MTIDNICPEEKDCVDKNELPSVMEMAKNLMSDGSKIVKNAMQGNKSLVEDSVRIHRWSTCQTCPRLQNDRCLECGCFMKVKVAFVTSKCPLEKW
jgi:hypothetical protein